MAMGNKQKNGEDLTGNSEYTIVDRQSYTQTDTLITILRSPIGGGVILLHCLLHIYYCG